MHPLSAHMSGAGLAIGNSLLDFRSNLASDPRFFTSSRVKELCFAVIHQMKSGEIYPVDLLNKHLLTYRMYIVHAAN